MSDHQIRAIIADRFTRWTRRLAESHATPIFVLGIGHDHASGTPVVCIPENLPSERELCDLLRNVADGLEAQAVT